jgi:hypothetical protein
MNYTVTKRSYISQLKRVAFVALVIFVVVGSAGAASAEIVLQSSAGTPLPRGNLVQYTISAVGTEGERIQTFVEPAISPVAGSLGIHNVAWALSNTGTPFKTNHVPHFFDPSWAAYDSFFLFGDRFEPPLSETNDGTTTGMLGLTAPVGVPRSGFGTFTPGLGPPMLFTAPGSNIPLMQVVMRRGDFALFDVEIAAEGGAPRTVISDYLIGVPEPATVFLVMPAALIVGRRQTRKRGILSLSAARF